jgi:hypothetical protein
MKRTAMGLLAGVVMATGVVVAQSAGQQPPPPQQQPPQQQQKQDKPEVTLTGCVTQGSSPAVFILDNARINTDDRTEKGKIFLLVAGAEDLNLKNHVNHEVSITGQADAKTMVTPPPGSKIEEKELPKLTAKSLTVVADKCTTAR